MAEIDEKKSVPERIDNKIEDFRFSPEEISNFIFDKNNQKENIKDLCSYLDPYNTPSRAEIYIRDNLMRDLRIFLIETEEIQNTFNGIENKVKNNEKLSKDEMSLIYLQAMIIGKNTKTYSIALGHIDFREKLKYAKKTFNPNDSIFEICDGFFLEYIRHCYGNGDYNPEPYSAIPEKINIKNENKNCVENPEKYKMEKEIKSQEMKYEGLPKIPLIEDKESVRRYCKEIVMRASRNGYLTKIEYKSKLEHGGIKDKKDFEDHVEYDKLLFAFSKYCDIVYKKHDEIIRKAGYIDMKDFTDDMAYMEEFQRTMKEKYPDIEDVMERLQPYFEKVLEIKDKYFKGKSEEEIEKGGEKFVEFQKFEEEQRKKYGINKTLIDSFQKTPETKEDIEKYFQNLNNIMGYQNEVNSKRQGYGDNGKIIDDYSGYITEITELKNKYSEEDFETISKYSSDISLIQEKEYVRYRKEWEIPQRGKVGTIFARISTYNNLLEKNKSLGINLKNISTISNIIKDPTNEDFWITGVKNEMIEKQKRQEKIDAIREFQKKYDPLNYYIFTAITGFHNSLIDATIGTGTSLGVLLLTTKVGNILLNYTTPIGLISLIRNGHLIDNAEYGEGEFLYQQKRKEAWDSFFKFAQSTSQKEPVYDPQNRTLNFKLDNTVSTIGSSVAQMMCLIYGGDVISKGVGKLGLGLSSGALSNIGLFTSSFITQVGNSYIEGRNSGLDGDRAFMYGILSASAQSTLEMVSPNRFLLGEGTGLGRQLISNICTNNVGLKTVGLYFLKETGKEIFEENVQEGLQLVAGNLINEMVNGVRKSDLEVNWDPKNFLSTAIITTLTTGVTKGFTAGKQGLNILNRTNTELMARISTDQGIYEEVMVAIDEYLDGKHKLPPEVNIEILKEVKTTLEGLYKAQNTNENQTETQMDESESQRHNTENQKNEESKGKQRTKNLAKDDGLHKSQTNQEGRLTDNYDDLTDEQKRNIEVIRGLGIEVNEQGDDIQEIKDIVLKPEDIKNINYLKVLGIRIKAFDINTVIGLTPENITNIETLIALGIKPYGLLTDLISITLTENEIKNLKKITDLGIVVYSGMVEYIKGISLTIDEIENIKKMQELGIEILAANIIITKGINLKEDEIKNIKNIQKLGIKITCECLDIVKLINLTDIEVENIKKMQEQGIEIFDKNLTDIKGITLDDVDIKKIKDLQILGITIDSENLIDILSLTDGDIKNLRTLNDFGYPFVSHVYKDIKGLEEKDIKNIVELQKIGIFIYYREIGNIKGLKETDIKNFNKLQNLGIELDNVDIRDITGLEDTDIENIKKLQNLGIKIEAVNIPDIKGLKDIDIENIKKLQNLGLKIEIVNIQDIKGLKDADIENIEKLQNLGMQIEAIYISDIKGLKDADIENIEKLQNLGIKIEAVDILDIKGLEGNIINELERLGIEIDKTDIGNIKGLEESDIKNIEKLKSLGIIIIDVEDICHLKGLNLSEAEINNLITLRNIGVEIQPRDLKNIIGITLSGSQLEKIEELIKKGFLISSEYLTDIINITDGDMKNIRELSWCLFDHKDIVELIGLSKENVENIKRFHKLGLIHSIEDVKSIKNNSDILDVNSQAFHEGYNRSAEENLLHYCVVRGTIVNGIEKQVQDLIKENRDIGEAEIIDKVRPSLIVLSKEERLQILSKIYEVVNKFNTIRKYIDFENGPYKDKYPNAKALLCAVNGITSQKIISNITDDITVIQHGVGLMFFVGDKRSYQIISDGDLKDSGRRSGGFNIGFSCVDELSGTLSVINSKDPGINTDDYFYGAVRHEGQHNRNFYFMPDKNGKAITYVKDEIIAYLRDGRGIFNEEKWHSTIEKFLTESESEGGLYQYGLQGEAWETHKAQVREMLSYVNDLILLTQNKNTGLTRDIVISVLSDTPISQWKDLHQWLSEAVKLHVERNVSKSKIREVRNNLISKIKEWAGNNRLITNLVQYWNSIFPDYGIDLEQFWWAGAAKKETVLNKITNCNSVKELKYILNDPQYSHIGRGPDNLGGIEVSAIIDKVLEGKLLVSYIPSELRPNQEFVNKFYLLNNPHDMNIRIKKIRI